MLHPGIYTLVGRPLLSVLRMVVHWPLISTPQNTFGLQRDT